MFFGFIIISFILFGLALSQSQPFVSPLKGTWRVTNSNGSISVAAAVPSGIYTDLRNANILKKSIFNKFNDVNYRWVGYDNWTYSSSFEVDDKVLNKSEVWIVFHGLDTIASIYLNGGFLGETDNMFNRYRYSVKYKLTVGTNTLSVKFTSPVDAAIERRTDYRSKYEYDVPPECTSKTQNGECHINYLRKMQASFSWDWGPAFPSVGIWKPVEIEAFNSLIIRSISVFVNEESDNKWNVSGYVYVNCPPDKTINTQLLIDILKPPSYKPLFPIHKTYKSKIQCSVDGEGEYMFKDINVPGDLVERWWPNGYGEQKLYKIRITVNDVAKNETTNKTEKFGFRTVKLVQEPVYTINKEDNTTSERSSGLTFYFLINGMKIFAQGSNFIPAHILPELSNQEELLQSILTPAKDVNMNMLRVWGGGIYADDRFYEICDEYGIMVWQDFMFACAMYPASSDFLQSVKTEAIQNVRRLQHHPSIVIWAGNNENELALRSNWYGTNGDFTLYKNDYIKLYVDTIKQVVEENDISREFLVSSPTNGLESDREGYIAVNPSSPLFGDVHDYQYMTDNWDHSNISPNRFCSEFGIQSFPSISTLLSVARESDLDLMSKFIFSRQHQTGGNEIIKYQINLNIPNFDHTKFEQVVYFSQVNQAMSIKTMVEKYRSMRDTLLPNGNGLTMGALYWQLNDVWQAPTWSSIEFGGKRKMLHYYAANFFSSISVISTIQLNRISVMVVVDKPNIKFNESVPALLLTSVYLYNSFSPVFEFATHTSIKTLSTTHIFERGTMDVVGTNTDCGNNPFDIAANCFLVFKLVVNELKQKIPESFLFLNNFKSINGLHVSTVQAIILPGMARLQYKNSTVRTNPHLYEYDINIITNKISFFIWLDFGSIKGNFSENGFHMITPMKQIHFSSTEHVLISRLYKELKLYVLKGNYMKGPYNVTNVGFNH